MFTRSKSNQFVKLNEFSPLRRRKRGIYIVVFTGFSDLFKSSRIFSCIQSGIDSRTIFTQCPVKKIS